MQHYARKRFGQNFLIDQHVIHSIIASINPQPTDKLVEIGPGRGALTAPLLRQAGHLSAIEIDRDLISLLQNSGLTQAGLNLLQADALNFDFAQLAGAGSIRVVGNLPYNIATPLLFKLMQCRAHIQDMHFMLQLEVAERIVAQPGSKAYGRLGIMLQYYCEAVTLFTVPAMAFQPQPKVESAVVYLKPYQVLPHASVDEVILQQVVQQAFAQRRKTLKNNLQGLVSLSQLEELHIQPQRRPEELSLEEYIKISQMVCK